MTSSQLHHNIFLFRCLPFFTFHLLNVQPLFQRQTVL